MPVSARKQAANRANAIKSTGPRTPEGKAVSSRNACRFGSASIGILANLRRENIADLHAIRAAMTDQYAPANIQEMQLIEIISNSYIRLQRAEEMSTTLLDGVMEAAQKQHDLPGGPTPIDALGSGLALTDKQISRAWQSVEQYRTRASLDYHRALNTLTRLQSLRHEEPLRQVNRELALDEQTTKLENRRRSSIAATERVPCTNEATDKPVTTAESTTVASFSQNLPAGVLAFPPPVTQNRAGNSQNCDNNKTPTISAVTVPPSRVLPDSHRK